MLHRLFGMQPAVPEIQVSALAAERAEGKDVQIVDVREPEEWSDGHMPGAVHIPLGELPARVRELDPARPVVLVCRSGNRSGQATQFLLQRGFRDARNLVGGMIAWAEAGQPVTR